MSSVTERVKGLSPQGLLTCGKYYNQHIDVMLPDKDYCAEVLDPKTREGVIFRKHGSGVLAIVRQHYAPPPASPPAKDVTRPPAPEATGVAGPGLTAHPLAEDDYPMLDGQDLADFVADIQQHGVREPIWLYEGQILDGRNRYLASQVAGVPCPTREFVGEDPADFVDSQNYYRRHLDDSQRAMKAAGLANRRTGQYSRGAVSAQQFGSAPNACPRCGGLRTKSKGRDAHGTPRHQCKDCKRGWSATPSSLGYAETMTLTQAARLLKVSPSSVSRAKRLQSKGAPEVIAAVDSGVLLLNTALPLLRLPRDAQAAALADVMRAGGGKRLPEATMRSILRQYQSDAAPAYQPKSRVEPTGRVGALTAQVAALEEELGAAVVQVVALDEDKRAALAQVADLKVKVAALEAQVAALGEDNRTLREGLRSPIEAFLLLLGQPVAAQGTNGHAVPVSVEGQGDSDDIPF